MKFTALLDKALLANVALSSWNPTMDLLALVTADNQVAVYRLNWQRLWSVGHLASPVTALCWSASGQTLAVGHQDGMLCLLNVENGEEMRRATVAGCALVAMSWAEDVTVEGSQPDTVLSTSRPPAWTLPFPAETLTANGVESQGARQPPKLDLLCAADAKGMLHVLTAGLLLLVHTQLRAPAVSEDSALQILRVP